MVKYLLDTCICVDILRGQPYAHAKLREVGRENCYVSVITIAELYYGIAKSNNPKHRNEVDVIKEIFGVLPVDDVLEDYGIIKANLEQQGQRVDDFDLLIGTTAIRNNMVMVTNNINHLQRLPGITTQSWNKKYTSASAEVS